ncbi:uncharacterized protein BP5553_01730 [Venustampulla echinocandica]|uniref:Uncharacterized protein n=1 Tax=Venustampulla echinocandica TaxID=2656787 RepID=A0A370U1W6_9HELO|nr:uncharacterized protein BP5553_01730 [Venustampulla echinocandica]RDL41751.1 hypothetical protein BP5553_01730 [Venustampulla echinocandica]
MGRGSGRVPGLAGRKLGFNLPASASKCQPNCPKAQANHASESASASNSNGNILHGQPIPTTVRSTILIAPSTTRGVPGPQAQALLRGEITADPVQFLTGSSGSTGPQHTRPHNSTPYTLTRRRSAKEAACDFTKLPPLKPPNCQHLRNQQCEIKWLGHDKVPRDQGLSVYYCLRALHTTCARADGPTPDTFVQSLGKVPTEPQAPSRVEELDSALQPKGAKPDYGLEVQMPRRARLYTGKLFALARTEELVLLRSTRCFTRRLGHARGCAGYKSASVSEKY